MVFAHFFRIPLPWLLMGVLIWGCTWSDDGAMTLNPDDDTISGEGFYLAAELDSSRRIHLRNDTLSLRLDSIWGVSPCFLKNLRQQSRVEHDTILYLRYMVELESSGDVFCPGTGFLPDTLLRIPMQTAWQNIRLIIVEGTARSAIFHDSTKKDDAAWNSPYLDSIRVKSGALQKDTLLFWIDSLFRVPAAWPRRTPGDTSLLIMQDSLRVRSYAWRPVPEICRKDTLVCATRPDTTWPGSWISTDTAWVGIRTACSDSTLQYCPGNTFYFDSTRQGPVLQRNDTLRYTSLYYMEKQTACAEVDSWQPLQGNLNANSKATFIRTLFQPSPSEPCPTPLQSRWFILHTATGTETVDSVHIQEILHAFEQAGIADPLPQLF